MENDDVDVRSAAVNFEAVKTSMMQDKNGTNIVSEQARNYTEACPASKRSAAQSSH